MTARDRALAAIALNGNAVGHAQQGIDLLRREGMIENRNPSTIILTPAGRAEAIRVLTELARIRRVQGMTSGHLAVAIDHLQGR